MPLRAHCERSQCMLPTSTIDGHSQLAFGDTSERGHVGLLPTARVSTTPLRRLMRPMREHWRQERHTERGRQDEVSLCKFKRRSCRRASKNGKNAKDATRLSSFRDLSTPCRNSPFGVVAVHTEPLPSDMADRSRPPKCGERTPARSGRCSVRLYAALAHNAASSG